MNNLKCLCGTLLVNTGFTSARMECVNRACNLSPEFDPEVTLPKPIQVRKGFSLTDIQTEGYWDVVRPNYNQTVPAQVWTTKAIVLAAAGHHFPFIVEYLWEGQLGQRLTVTDQKVWDGVLDMGSMNESGTKQLLGMRLVRRGC